MAILYNNATPVFANIESDTLNIDVKKIEKRINSKRVFEKADDRVESGALRKRSIVNVTPPVVVVVISLLLGLVLL